MENAVTLRRFEFRDLASGWTLEPIDFGAFNLLIGLSGSGKTSILRALMQVVECGGSDMSVAWHAEWSLTLAVDGEAFVWSVRTAPPAQNGDFWRPAKPRVLIERLVNGAGEVIIDRDEERLTLRGQPLPRIDLKNSALSLLSEEEPVSTVCKALTQIRLSWGTRVGSTNVTGVRVGLETTHRARLSSEHVERFVGLISTISELRRLRIPIEALASLLLRLFPERFEAVVNEFKSIFPNVAEVKVALLGEMKEPRSWITESELRQIDIGLREHGMTTWAVGDEISFGMRRTLLHLLELELLPAGSVVLVDEFEQSLGLNCLDSLTKRLQDRAGEVQFVLTSHHPAVLNNIGREDWRIVTRKGAVVKVVRAHEIPELNTRSAQSGFALLMNSETFRESVS